LGLDKKDFFYGKIDFVQVYLINLPTELINAIADNIKMIPNNGQEKK